MYRRLILAVSGHLLLLGPAAVAEPPPGEELVRRIDAYVAPYLADEQLSGHLLVESDGQVVYERFFGFANWELEVPVTAETRFNVASVSKPMTGLLGLQLIQAGSLGFGDHLARWIPDFPSGDKITVEHLFRHRAGIPHRLTTETEESQPKSAAEMVELARRAPLLFEPGTDSVYSSGGYSVAARVLELAGGASYGELLQRHVFSPAGMRHSVHPEDDRLIPQRADGYLIGADGAVRNAAVKHYSYLVGAGSVFSTARDLLALQRALRDGRFGEAAIQNYVREGNIFWNGRSEGYRAFADFHGDSGVTVIFTGNLVTGAVDRVQDDVPRIAAGETVAVPERLAIEPVEVPAEVLERYKGVYRLRPGSELELSVRDGAARLSGWTLIPTSATDFFSPQDYARVKVVLADDGSVDRLDWKIGDEVYPLPRLGPLPGE